MAAASCARRRAALERSSWPKSRCLLTDRAIRYNARSVGDIQPRCRLAADEWKRKGDRRPRFQSSISSEHQRRPRGRLPRIDRRRSEADQKRHRGSDVCTTDPSWFQGGFETALASAPLAPREDPDERSSRSLNGSGGARRGDRWHSSIHLQHRAAEEGPWGDHRCRSLPPYAAPYRPEGPSVRIFRLFGRYAKQRVGSSSPSRGTDAS